MRNPLDLTLPQVTAIFERHAEPAITLVSPSERKALNLFAAAWLSGNEQFRAMLYHTALELIYHFKLEQHVEPPLPVSTQSYADSAHILRGMSDDLALNAEESCAYRAGIKALEKLDQIKEML